MATGEAAVSACVMVIYNSVYYIQFPFSVRSGRVESRPRRTGGLNRGAGAVNDDFNGKWREESESMRR